MHDRSSSFPGFPLLYDLESRPHYLQLSADAAMGLFFYEMKVLVLFLLLSAAPMVVLSTQLEGTIKHHSGSHFVRYLAKFGVKEGRSAFMFGTAERKGNRLVSFHSLMTLAFVPDGVWNHFYHVASKHHHVCQDIMNDTLFSRTTTSDCIGGTQDYLRQVPCDSNKCINQPGDVELISGENFTYRLLPTKTEFYYVFLVACARNANETQNCYWESSDDVEIKYDIHIVNSDPDVVLRPNPFVYEFSYDLQSLLMIFMTFTFCYYAMLIFHILINCTSRGLHMHRLVIIFTISLILEAVFVSFELIHYAVYAHDGMGVVALKYLGEVADQVSDWLLILVFILIGKGWQLTIATIRWKKVTFLIWGIYIAFSAIYFIWLVVIEQVYPFSTENYQSYQTWAGGLYLAYRLVILFYVLYELRQIYLIEDRRVKLVLYRLLLVFYLIWFLYLPLIVVIALFVNPLERLKVIQTSSLIVDVLANGTMILLFCPKWSDWYFQFKSEINELSRISFRLEDHARLKTYGSSSTVSEYD